MSITYSNVRIWDGVAETYSDYDSITIQDNLIEALGRRDPDSRDMSGLTVLPGLMDAHVHMTLDPAIPSVDEQLAQTDEEIRDKMVKRAADMIRGGITSARDLGGGKWLELELRDRINRRQIPGPRLLCAGQPLTSVNGHCHFWGGVASSTDEIQSVIARQHERGVDLIKIMATGGMYTKSSQPGRAQFSQEHMDFAVQHANDHGFAVAAHCHGTEGIERAVNAGVTTVEHCSWLQRDSHRGPCDLEVVANMAKRGTWVSPTINAGWSRFKGGDGKFLKYIQSTFDAMKRRGVQLVASTDAGIPNVKHHELAHSLPIFAEFARLSPIESLRSATSDAAKALSIASETGKITVGMSADLLFVEGDPLQNLEVLQKPALVVARGTEHSL